MGDEQRSTWVVVVAVGAAVLALLVVGSIIAGRALVHAGRGPAVGAAVYLQTVRDRDDAAGYELLCRRLRESTTPAQYAAALDRDAERDGRLLRYDVSGLSHTYRSADGLAEYHAETERTHLHRLARMRKENGTWHWCGSDRAPRGQGVHIHIHLP